MPRLSCWYVRAALIYLATGFTLGAVMLANKALGAWPWAWRLLPLHTEFLLVGWTLQLAMGVGFWIMPRFGGSRGREGLAWAAWWLINVGVLWGAVALWAGWPSLWLGRVLELSGVAFYAAHVWPRIKPAGVR